MMGERKERKKEYYLSERENKNMFNMTSSVRALEGRVQFSVFSVHCSKSPMSNVL